MPGLGHRHHLQLAFMLKWELHNLYAEFAEIYNNQQKRSRVLVSFCKRKCHAVASQEAVLIGVCVHQLHMVVMAFATA